MSPVQPNLLPQDNKPVGSDGHRARLRQRLLDGGGDALLDHELVEYLLTLAIPRRDTKPLAKRLISTFGGSGRCCPRHATRSGGKALQTG